MGLIISNYTVKDYGITLDNAYAQLTSINVGIDSKASCIFEIQQTREDIKNKESLERKFFSCEINKDLPLYRQVYQKAKEDIFPEWEDDIV